jgi:uncharacterized membrane protein HdeD (DUF308 family)
MSRAEVTVPSMQTTWWVVVLRGLAGIAFGVLALAWPGLTLLALVILFGAYALVDGAANIAGAFERRRTYDRWWVLLVEGVVSVLVGVLTVIWPAVTGLALLILVAVRAIVVGIFEIVAAIRLRREITGEWLLAASGLLSVLFGGVLLLFPATGALALTWMIGWWAIVVGLLLVVLGVRLRGVRRSSGAARVR